MYVSIYRCFLAITIEVKNIKTGEIIEKGSEIIHFDSKEDAIGPNPNEKGDKHYLTLTDLMYMIAMDVLVEGNYHVYTTRYPASEFQNIYPSRIKVKTTGKTKNIWYSVYEENNTTGYNEFLLKNYKNYQIIK